MPPNLSPTLSLPDPSSFAAPLYPPGALPSPIPSPSSPLDTSSAPWVRRQQSPSRRLHNPFYRVPRQEHRSRGNSLIASAKNPGVILGKCIRASNKFLTHTGRAFLALTMPQRVLVVVLALAAAAAGAAFLAYSHKIFVWLRPVADSWRKLPGGWLIIFALSTATAFPPLIGYSTVVAISGFLYGFPGGWPVVAAANVVGSTLSLIHDSGLPLALLAEQWVFGPGQDN